LKWLPLMIFFVLSTLFALIAGIIFYQNFIATIGLPPGPFRAPVIGNFYCVNPEDKDLVNGKSLVHKVFTQLSQKFGGVFSFWFGGKYTVVISSPALAHEALKVKGEDFAGRWAPNSMHIITRGKGIALNGDLKRWKAFRSFLMQAMTSKQQGPKAEPVIVEETYSTMALFKKLADKGEALSVRLHTKRESLNVVMRLGFGFRYSERLSPEFVEIQDIIGKIFENISAGNPSDYMTFLQYLPTDMSKELREVTAKRDRYLEKWISDHKKAIASNPDKPPGDVLDEMLMNQKESNMTDEDILVILWDMMAGGIDTTATTIEWLIYILINHPEVQQKMQQELMSVVGAERLPTFADKDRLPYCNAVISECFRYKHFAPFGIPHATTRSTTLGGYRVPKNAQVMINIYALHMDTKSWVRPEEFRPERFLEEEKDLAGFVMNPESHATRGPEAYKFLPYGTGRRMCVGSGLGRVVMMLKVATYLHCFTFLAVDGQQINTAEEHFGVTLVPNEYQVQLKARPPASLAKSIDGNGCVPEH